MYHSDYNTLQSFCLILIYKALHFANVNPRSDKKMIHNNNIDIL